MTDQGERYDRIAEGYRRWWAPVLVRDAVATLDMVAADVAAGARQILDLGTGTGTLALAAIERWPGVRVTGIDASAEMIGMAEAEADRRLSPADRGRFTARTAYADALPFGDGKFDLVLSSFVVQLVPSRIRALREAHRVLRPGGRIAYTTWLAGDAPFAGDRVFDEVLEELGIRTEEADDGPADRVDGDADDHARDGRSGDLRSTRAAADGLRRAGFEQARATAGLLEHAFDPAGYVGFLTEFDEEDLFGGLVERRRVALEARLLERLTALPPGDLVLRLPTVTASARRAAARRA